MNTIDRIDEMVMKRRDTYIRYQDRNLLPDTVFLGRKEHKDILINSESNSGVYLIMNADGDQVVFGLNIIPVNMDSYLAIACTCVRGEEEG